MLESMLQSTKKEKFGVSVKLGKCTWKPSPSQKFMCTYPIDKINHGLISLTSYITSIFFIESVSDIHHILVFDIHKRIFSFFFTISMSSVEIMILVFVKIL